MAGWNESCQRISKPEVDRELSSSQRRTLALWDRTTDNCNLGNAPSFGESLNRPQKLTVLNESLRPREPPMDSCHVQRALPILTLTEIRQKSMWSVGNGLKSLSSTAILQVKPLLASKD